MAVKKKSPKRKVGKAAKKSSRGTAKKRTERLDKKEHDSPTRPPHVYENGTWYLLDANGNKFAECSSPHPGWNDKSAKAAKKSSRGTAKKKTMNLPRRPHTPGEPHSPDNRYILDAPGGRPIAECTSPHGPPKSKRPKR